jgi:pyruvate kinase
MRRAKIVCTLGPATNSYEQLRALVDAGMDVARFNLSHGGYPEHEERYHRVRKAAEESGRSVGVLVDLQGPKIRLGTFAEGPVLLERGDEFTITTEDHDGDKHMASTTYKGLAGDVSKGERILVDDGRVTLEVTAVEGSRVHTMVIEGGMISDNKGLNLPGVAVSVPALSEKDIEDLKWGLKLGADMIALSFVRSAKDIVDVHRIMDEVGIRRPVIAKIEKPQAVDQLDGIVEAFDAIMVARGDLGVEMPLEQVPLVQKRCITLARAQAKPVIVATQMLESMISTSRPTRAEASDVANAVLDGTDAVMLSGETAVGKYPIETVKTMSRIVVAAESSSAMEEEVRELPGPKTQGGVISKAAIEIAERLDDVKYLVAFTQSGDTGRRVSRYRSKIPMLAFTPDQKVRNFLALSWGVETYASPLVDHTDEMVRQVDQALLKMALCKPGDVVVVTAGSPPGVPGSTNMVRVHHIGEMGATANEA